MLRGAILSMGVPLKCTQIGSDAERLTRTLPMNDPENVRKQVVVPDEYPIAWTTSLGPKKMTAPGPMPQPRTLTDMAVLFATTTTVEKLLTEVGQLDAAPPRVLSAATIRLLDRQKMLSTLPPTCETEIPCKPLCFFLCAACAVPTPLVTLLRPPG